MSLRDLLSRYIPISLKRIVRKKRAQNEVKNLYSLERTECNVENLNSSKGIHLDKIFKSRKTEELWKSLYEQTRDFHLPGDTGGVNHGDRRAIFYTVCFFEPENVLEIGTHIGASTIHISNALFYTRVLNGKNAKLTTVDMRDVNSGVEKPWRRYGAKFSPERMIRELGHQKFVNFKADKSLNFMNETNESFDFIFLDGSHNASNVYQEIPAALQLLNPEGNILLHDYYPDNKPLWKDRKPVYGPYRAVERLKKEGANFKVVPLGELPWETKNGTTITSLALMFRGTD
ncbi:MAG: hypothetical protein GVY08_08305 [Bacteroidetes bacterium]|jgi:predicted O-methyltransferase YrrM|nr:hypothetical protein [Bacteroidota bacterium]